MSQWANIDLTTIPTGLELLPKGEYTFAILPGSKFNDKDSGRVDFSLSVVGGEFVGKRIYSSFPNPDSFPWSATAFKRLVEAVGTDVEAGENPVSYLNRVANLHVNYPVEHKTDSQGVERANVNLFKPRPATQ